MPLLQIMEQTEKRERKMMGSMWSGEKRGDEITGNGGKREEKQKH